MVNRLRGKIPGIPGLLKIIRGCYTALLCIFVLTACGGIPDPAKPGFERNAQSSTVNMHLLHTSDQAILPLLPVTMAGKTYWWLLDTGSSHNLVTTELASALEMKAVAESEMATIGGRKLSTHHQLPELKIAGLRLRRQSASAADLSQLSAPGYQVSGILGVPALSELQVLLDFPQRRMILSKKLPASVQRAVSTELPFTLRGGVPVAGVSIDGRKADVILDTGNATSLVLLPAFTRFNPTQQFSFIETQDLGGHIPARLARVRQLQLGRQQFVDIPVSLPLQNNRFQRSAVVGSLGNGLLAQQPVIFDFPGQRLLVLRNAAPRAQSGGFGFRLARSNQIEVVLPNSPARYAGLQAGERIIAVDGVPTNNAYQIWPNLNNKQQVSLTIQRGGQLYQARLQRQRFLPVLQ